MLCYEKYRDVFVIFIVFAGAIPLLWILSPRETSFCTSTVSVFSTAQAELVKVKACAVTVRLMYCIDELLNWQYEHRDHKQATRRNLTPTIYICFKTSMYRNRLLIHGELYQRTLKTELSEAKTFLTSFKEHLRGSLAIVRTVRLSSLIIGDQNTLVDLTRDTFEETIIVNRSTQQRYSRFNR